jgi:hypothetical protein
MLVMLKLMCSLLFRIRQLQPRVCVCGMADDTRRTKRARTEDQNIALQRF